MNKLHRVARKLIPRPLHIFLLPPRRNTDRDARVRKDVRKLPINAHAHLDVYWKSYGQGSGPAVILNVHGHEVIKFDCYANAGHYHVRVMEWGTKRKNLLRLSETTREAQIDRAVFELRHNIHWYLERHPLAKVRRIHLDSQRLMETTEAARTIMLGYLEKL